MKLSDLRLLQTYCPEIAAVPITRMSRTDLLDCLAHAWLASRRGGGFCKALVSDRASMAPESVGRR